MSAPEPINDESNAQRLIAEMTRSMSAMQKTIEQLREELALYKRKLFGRSSERHVEDDSQLHLFENKPSDTAPPEVESDEDDDTGKKKKRKRRRKSEKIPAHLPRQVIEADVLPAQCICPCCGDVMSIIGTDISERLDMVPAKMFVIQIRRPKRACGKCKETIVQGKRSIFPC